MVGGHVKSLVESKQFDSSPVSMWLGMLQFNDDPNWSTLITTVCKKKEQVYSIS